MRDMKATVRAFFSSLPVDVLIPPRPTITVMGVLV
jgi:hypothetical protein